MANETNQIGSGMVYTLEDVPKPFGKALGLGIQHVLTMFGATVAVPLILGPAMNMSAAQIAILVSSVMLASGLATLVQVNFGTRLPIIQGVSFAFLGPFFAIIAAQGSAELSMQYIAGAVILGSLVEIIVGFSGLMGLLRKLITPITIGPTIAMIGLALYTAGAPQAGQNWLLAIVVVVLAFIFSLVTKNKMIKLFPILLAVIIAYLLALVLSAVGVFAPGTPGFVDFSTVAKSPWFRIGVIFPWGPPKFSIPFFLATLAAYLASMIESFGDYHSVASAAQAPPPSGKQINRGIGCEGIGCLITGFVGGFASTSYTENIGLVGLTKVASRYVVNLAAVILIILGIFAKFGAVVATIPPAIVGGLYLALFGLIAAIGLSNLKDIDWGSQRNLMIIGFILFMGLSLPVYFQNTPVTIAAAPWLAEIINTIGGTGMAITAILGIIMDNLIPGTDEERGLKSKSWTGNESTEQVQA